MSVANPVKQNTDRVTAMPKLHERTNSLELVTTGIYLQGLDYVTDTVRT